MDLNNKGKHYVKIYRDTDSNNIYALVDEVESHEENDIDNLLNNPDTESVLGKYSENDIPDEQSNNVLIPEVIIHLVKDAEFGVNDGERNVKS